MSVYIVLSVSQHYRAFAAAIFDEAARLTNLSNIELAEQLRRELGRDELARTTIGAWRSGEQQVPAAVLLAVLRQIGRLPADLMILVALRDTSFMSCMPEDLPAAIGRHEQTIDALRAIRVPD